MLPVALLVSEEEVLQEINCLLALAAKANFLLVLVKEPAAGSKQQLEADPESGGVLGLGGGGRSVDGLET